MSISRRKRQLVATAGKKGPRRTGNWWVWIDVCLLKLRHTLFTNQLAGDKALLTPQLL